MARYTGCAGRSAWTPGAATAHRMRGDFVGRHGLVGLALAQVGTRLLISLAPRDLDVRGAGLNTPVLWFTALAALATAAAFGLIPALQTARRDLHENLKDGSRGATSGPGAGRLRRALVAIEVALSTGPAGGGGSAAPQLRTGNSAWTRASRWSGLSPRIWRCPRSNTMGRVRRRFVRQWVESVRGLPGVIAAGAVSGLPSHGQLQHPHGVPGIG